MTNSLKPVEVVVLNPLDMAEGDTMKERAFWMIEFLDADTWGDLIAFGDPTACLAYRLAGAAEGIDVSEDFARWEAAGWKERVA